MPCAFGVAAVIETVAVHFLVPWSWLQWSLVGSSLSAVLFFLGTLAHHRLHPHTLDSHELKLQVSGTLVAAVPRDSIVRVHVHRRYGVITRSIVDGRLFLPTQDGTSVDIELSEPVGVRVPAPFKRWRIEGCVDSLALQVDDPAALVRSLRTEPNAYG